MTTFVLVDGWTAADGAGMFSLAPAAFVDAARTAAESLGGGRLIPAPPAAAFGIVDADEAARLAARLRPRPLPEPLARILLDARSFKERKREV